MSETVMPASAPGLRLAHKYPNVIRLVMETPWAIVPAKLAAILDLLALRDQGGYLSDDEIADRIGAARRRPGGATKSGAVAVIPIHGVITPKATLFTEISGGTSMESLIGAVRAAAGNDNVSAIVLDVDSPGGLTDLVPEAAAELRAARSKKPLVAVANTDAGSAAYWLASQADRLLVTPSGMAGSIGVFAAHDDISAMQEMLGIKTTFVKAGKFKTEGNPYEPLSAEARDAIQRVVDEFYGMFTSDVAKGRGVPVADVRSGFGEGRMVTAKEAVRLGMADQVGTLEDAIAAAASARRRAVAAVSAIPITETTYTEPPTLWVPYSAREATDPAPEPEDEPLTQDDQGDEAAPADNHESLDQETPLAGDQPDELADLKARATAARQQAREDKVRLTKEMLR